jgi:hypothetical protein
VPGSASNALIVQYPACGIQRVQDQSCWIKYERLTTQYSQSGVQVHHYPTSPFKKMNDKQNDRSPQRQ